MIGPFNATHVVGFVGIAVSAVVALIVAAQNRKQSRQIELYKRDPSVGLVAPDSFITRAIKSHWINVLAYGIPLANIIIEMGFRSGPVSRSGVLLISLSVSALTLNLVLFAVGRVIRTVVSSLKEHVDKTREMGDVIVGQLRDHVAVTSKMADVLSQVTALTTRLDLNEQAAGGKAAATPPE